MIQPSVSTRPPIASRPLLEALAAAPVIPTVFPDHPDNLCRVADLLVDEGYPAIELLCRPYDETLPLLAELSRRPQWHRLHWGVGTLRTRSIAEQVARFKPAFLVSPAYSRRVFEVALEHDLTYIPGVFTFRDIQEVIDAFEEHGREVSLLKLCPAIGLTDEYLQAMQACYPGIAFCPSGEPRMQNYVYWKSRPGIAAPMGGGFVLRDLIMRGDVAEMRKALQQLRQWADEARNKT